MTWPSSINFIRNVSVDFERGFKAPDGLGGHVKKNQVKAPKLEVNHNSFKRISTWIFHKARNMKMCRGPLDEGTESCILKANASN